MILITYKHTVFRRGDGLVDATGHERGLNRQRVTLTYSGQRPIKTRTTVKPTRPLCLKSKDNCPFTAKHRAKRVVLSLWRNIGTEIGQRKKSRHSLVITKA